MIILDSIEKGTKFTIGATEEIQPRTGEHFFSHFGIVREHSHMWGRKPEDVVDVECEIVDNDLSIESLMKDENYDNNCVDYFACIYVREDNTFNVGFIFPNIKQFFVCFPYGTNESRFYTNGKRRSYMARLKVNKK